MSQLEHRLSREMHAIAERIVPGDLRPLRPPLPGAWPREPWHRLAPAVAIAAIALVTGVLVMARHDLAPPPASPSSSARSVADPATVAVASTSNVLRVLAVPTGQIVRTVRIAGAAHGIALAPDAKSVFVAGPTFMLSQVVIATGKVSRIGTGAYPAVSPNSRYLAYAAGSAFTSIAVRDLHTGLTRSIDLYSLIGSGSSLLNRGGLTWLGDGTQIVAISEPAAISLAAMTRTAAPPVWTTDCGQQTSRRGLCAIVINVAFRSASTATGESLPRLALRAYSVYVEHVSARQDLDLISGDLAERHSIFIGQSGRSASVVTKVRLDGGTPATRRVAVLPPTSIPLAVDPDGDRLIYVPRGSPTSLWVAALHRGRLKHKRRLMADSPHFEFNLVSW